jgi:predicted outer membrane protein
MAHVNPVQIQKFLKGVDYPASKAELLENARNMGADANVCASLEQLPDEDYQTPADVSQAFGQMPDDGGGGKQAKQDGKRDDAQGARRDGKQEAKADGKQEARRDGKEAARGDDKAGAKRDDKAEAKRDDKAEAKRDDKAEAKRDHKAEAHGDDKAEARRDHKAEAKREGKEEGKRDGRQGARAEPEPRYTGSNEFLIQAMQDSMAEIQICEIAIEKSANEDVKSFAQSMIDEHGRMGREMEELASQKQLAVPREIRPEQEMTVEELASLDGRDFEQRWIQYNIDVHERDLKVFSHYAGEEPDAEIKKMAENGARMLGQHLKMAHDVGKKLARP